MAKGHSKGSNGGSSGGKKGRSGRKSAFEEHICANAVKDAFINGVDLEALKKRIKPRKGKKVKLIDIAIARAFNNEHILMDLLKKLLPDKISSEIKTIHDVDKAFLDRVDKLLSSKSK